MGAGAALYCGLGEVVGVVFGVVEGVGVEIGWGRGSVVGVGVCRHHVVVVVVVVIGRRCGWRGRFGRGVGSGASAIAGEIHSGCGWHAAGCGSTAGGCRDERR